VREREKERERKLNKTLIEQNLFLDLVRLMFCSTSDKY